MVEDRSIDLAFSFDSLVHAEGDVLDGYVEQLARKLSPTGSAFAPLEHRAIGLAALARRMPEVAPSSRRRGLLDRPLRLAGRERDRAGFAARCEAAGMACIAQEHIAGSMAVLIDASPCSRRADRGGSGRCESVRNPLFRAEADRMRRLYVARR